MCTPCNSCFLGPIRVHKDHRFCHFWATACKTVRPKLSDGRPASTALSCRSVCLSVALVHCGQTVGWIKMKLGTEVRLDPGHIVLVGDPASPGKGAQQPPICGPRLLWPNGRMDQHATWYGGRHIVLDGDPAPLIPKRGLSSQFSAHVYGDQTARWINMPLGIEVKLGPGHIVLHGDSATQEPQPPNFRPMSVVAKRLDGSRCYLVGS